MKTGDKFASRSRWRVFVGYTYGKKGWDLYDLEKWDFFVSRDVVFSKGVFPFADNFIFDDNGLPDDEVVHEDLEESPTPVLRGVKEFVQSACEPNGDAEQLVCVSREDDLDEDQEEMLGRGQRRRQAFVQLRDYITHTIQKMSPSAPSPPIPQHSSGTPYPITHYRNCDNFSVCHRNFITALTTTWEPM